MIPEETVCLNFGIGQERDRGNMNVDFAFICDHAQAGDKINALGIGFERISTSQIPVRHPHFSVVAQLRFNRIEVGTKDIRANLIDDDGADVISPISGQLVIQEPPYGTSEVSARLVMEFNNVEFRKCGDYSVRINVAGQEAANIHLAVSPPASKVLGGNR